MYKLTKNAKYKMLIGATIGTLAGGFFSIGMNNLKVLDNEPVTFPLILDDIETYGVTIKEYNIPKLKGIGSGFTVSIPKKEYMTKKDITQINSLEVSLYSPWNKINNWEYDDQYFRYEYYCNFPIDNITESELKDVIDLFKTYQIKEIFDISPISYKKEVTQETINVKELSNTYPQVKLTTKIVDYDDIKTTKQIKKENIEETNLWIITSLIGFCYGIIIGFKDSSLKESQPNTVKKLTKKKK